jgi:hypothetical protein
MKTAMQELIEQLKEERDGFLKLPPHSNIQERTENCFGSCIEIAERMLQKEKEQMCQFADEFAIECINFHHEKTMSQEKFFDLTFNTNEK